VKGALLICSVDTPGYRERTVTQLFVPGANAGGDLQMVLTRRVGDSEVFIMGNGPRDANSGLVGAPLADLVPGDTLRLDVYDRDVLSRELLERVELTYRGRSPWSHKGRLASTTCRLLPRAAVEDEALLELQRVDLRLEQYDRQLHPDVSQRGWGLRQSFSATDLKGLAGFVGWADERVQRRLRRPEALQQRFDVELRQALAKLLGGLRASGGWVELEPEGLAMRFVMLRCEKKGGERLPELTRYRGGCALHMHLRNRAEQPLERGLSISPLGRLDLVLPGGRSLDVVPHGVWADGKLATGYPAHPRRLEATSTVQLVYTVPGLPHAQLQRCGEGKAALSELLLRGMRELELTVARGKDPPEATPPVGTVMWLRAPLTPPANECLPGSRSGQAKALPARLRE